MFPLMSWQQFCVAFGESKEIRTAWDNGQKIRGGAPQQFKTRGCVQRDSLLGAEVEKSYVGLTESEFLDMFKTLGCLGNLYCYSDSYYQII